MSKNTKGCQYKFKQGAKKGKFCRKTCRGRFCCDHKPKKINYLKKYREEQSKEKFKNKLEKLKVKNLDKLSFEKEKLKYKMYQDEMYGLYKILVGIYKFLDIDNDKLFEKMKDIAYGKCICIDINDEYDIPIETKEKIENDDCYKAYGDNNLLEYIIGTYKCKEEDCKKIQYDWCKRCSPPIGRVLYIPFDGSTKMAELKLKRIKKQIDDVKKLINKQKEIIKLIENQ